MNGLVFVLLIAWLVFSAVSKRKRQAAAEEARRAAAEQASAQASPDAKPVYDAPVQRPAGPEIRQAQPAAPAQPAFDPFFGGLTDAPAKPVPARDAQRRPLPQQARVESKMVERSTKMQSTLRHTLESSSITGHAHTESSITGIEPECPPESARTAPVSAAARARSGESAFTWNVSDAAKGLVLAEILGKPRALRQ